MVQCGSGWLRARDGERPVLVRERAAVAAGHVKEKRRAARRALGLQPRIADAYHTEALVTVVASHPTELVKVEEAAGRQVLTPEQATACFAQLDEEASVDEGDRTAAELVVHLQQRLEGRTASAAPSASGSAARRARCPKSRTAPSAR